MAKDLVACRREVGKNNQNYNIGGEENNGF